jgi:hypothetical protein
MEVWLALFVIYGVLVASLLWYTLSYLPFPELRQNAGFVLNIIQYALVSFLSFRVYRQELHFRRVFFQFWVYFTALGLSAPIVYHCMYWYGGWYGFLSYMFMLMAVHFLMAWVTSKILFHYIFYDEKRWAINLLSTLVVLPLCLWLFWPFWWSPEAILSLPTAKDAVSLYRPIEKAFIIVNIFSLVLLVAFFLHKLKTDKPIGAFADTLLFLFGLMIAVDTVEQFARVNSLELMNITQFGLGFIAVAIIITLLLRYKYKSQKIADYYESQCLSHDPRVGRRVGLFDRLILWCFFDPKKIGQRIYLGPGRQAVTIKRTPTRVIKPVDKQ